MRHTRFHEVADVHVMLRHTCDAKYVVVADFIGKTNRRVCQYVCEQIVVGMFVHQLIEL